MIKETYLANLKKMKHQYPAAHFEVITQTAKSPLAPSWELLKQAKARGINKKVFETFYKPRFINEIKDSEQASNKIKALIAIARDQDIFLVCYEKEPSLCHRSIIQELLTKCMNEIHDFKEEYYGDRCTICGIFYPNNSNWWADNDYEPEGFFYEDEEFHD